VNQYYFDVRQDGDLATDDNGVEISARSNVRSEALAYLGEIAREVISADEGVGSFRLKYGMIAASS
jgi:hypothetical protein